MMSRDPERSNWWPKCA